jgi:hypothetical protein
MDSSSGASRFARILVINLAKLSTKPYTPFFRIKVIYSALRSLTPSAPCCKVIIYCLYEICSDYGLASPIKLAGISI